MQKLAPNEQWRDRLFYDNIDKTYFEKVAHRQGYWKGFTNAVGIILITAVIIVAYIYN